MEPRKITGLTVHPQDGSPAIDVDTAVLALYDQLGREGDTRARDALGALINFASQANARQGTPWQVRDGVGSDVRGVEWCNETTRVMQLAPRKEWDEDERVYFRNNGRRKVDGPTSG